MKYGFLERLNAGAVSGEKSWRTEMPCRISGETDPRSILEIKPLESIVGAVSNA